MPGVSTEQTGRFRRALFPLHGDQFAWRIASVGVSLVSVALIVVTLGYKLRGGEPPSVLLLALLTAFAIVVLLLSKFLHLAYHEQTQTAGALDTTEREFQSIFENALDAILILDDQAVCREANPAAERLFGVQRQKLIGQSIHRFYKDSSQFKGSWERLLAEKFLAGGRRAGESRPIARFCRVHSQGRLSSGPTCDDSARYHPAPASPAVAPRKRGTVSTDGQEHPGDLLDD